MNQEGYRDPTADKDVANAEKERHIPKQLYEPVKKMKEILEFQHIYVDEIKFHTDSGKKFEKKWR